MVCCFSEFFDKNSDSSVSVLGLISNVMLIYLCVRFSKKNLGSYKYLLIIFASYDLYLTVLHAIVDPVDEFPEMKNICYSENLQL